MATKKTDPLAGIPVATAKPARVPKPAAGVINLAAAKKKRKLTGQDRKNAVEFARGMVGYDDTSPIWGKRQLTVLTDIEANLADADAAFTRGDYGDAQDATQVAATYVSELKKRLAFGQIMKAQS